MTPPPSARELAALRRRDPALGRFMKTCGPFPRMPQPGHARLTHYEVLARSIVHQQLSGKAAATIWSRCTQLGGGRFPNAERLAAFSDEALRSAGVSRPKLRALRSLAEAVNTGAVRLGTLGRRGDEQILEELVQLHGIGRWTAQMLLIFKLGRLDVLPIHDLGVQEGLRRLDGLDERPTPAELAERAECWSPLRSVASWYLWRLADQV